MKRRLIVLLAALAGPAAAETPAAAFPGLPPAEVVARVLREHPEVQAAAAQVSVEEAHRQRLQAGEHEWNVRLGGQQRRSRPATGPEEQFNEWNAALERPLRLPGKATLDGRLGEAGVALAEAAHGDALHEASRRLLLARVLEMVRKAEYKRRQAPPGVRISGRAVGRDWRYPITSGYRHR